MYVRYETRPDIPARSFKSKKSKGKDDEEENDNDMDTSMGASSAASVQGGDDLPLRVFKDNMKIAVTGLDEEKIEFDLSGVDASYANALRRIMLDEVPSVAIEIVEISTNTSIIQDEVLAHRLGLIPILVDPEIFPMYSQGDELNESNCIEFVLDVKCHKQGNEIRNGAGEFLVFLFFKD